MDLMTQILITTTQPLIITQILITTILNQYSTIGYVFISANNRPKSDPIPIPKPKTIDKYN